MGWCCRERERDSASSRPPLYAPRGAGQSRSGAGRGLGRGRRIRGRRPFSRLTFRSRVYRFINGSARDGRRRAGPEWRSISAPLGERQMGGRNGPQRPDRLTKDDVLAVAGLTSRRSATERFLTASGLFGAGVLVGVVVALLLAPKSGRGLREDIVERLRRVPGRTEKAPAEASPSGSDHPLNVTAESR